jgi:hypothetical protein
MFMSVGLDAVHIGLPKRTAVHAANLVHRFTVKCRIGYVYPVLKPTHAIGFIGPIRLDGYARDEYGGLGAFGRTTGSKNEGKGGENESFFHVDMRLKVKN